MCSSDLLTNLRRAVTSQMMRVELAPAEPEPMQGLEASHPSAIAAGRAPIGDAPAVDPNDPSTWGQVSRNAPCPCGSGKKYKHCHGAFV